MFLPLQKKNIYTPKNGRLIFWTGGGEVGRGWGQLYMLGQKLFKKIVLMDAHSVGLEMLFVIEHVWLKNVDLIMEIVVNLKIIFFFYSQVDIFKKGTSLFLR